MRHHITAIAVCFLSNSWLCSAQTVQDAWLIPNPPDFADTFLLNQQYTIEWTNTLWENFAAYEPDADVSNVDLWITGYDIHQYAHLVSSMSSL